MDGPGIATCGTSSTAAGETSFGTSNAYSALRLSTCCSALRLVVRLAGGVAAALFLPRGMAEIFNQHFLIKRQQNISS